MGEFSGAGKLVGDVTEPPVQVLGHSHRHEERFIASHFAAFHQDPSGLTDPLACFQRDTQVALGALSITATAA